MSEHPSSNPRSPYAVKKTRPVVRSFRAAFSKNALTWVRAGGHAIVWESAKKAWLVVPKPAPNHPEDKGLGQRLHRDKTTTVRFDASPHQGPELFNIGKARKPAGNVKTGPQHHQRGKDLQHPVPMPFPERHAQYMLRQSGKEPGN